jgi:hypothetical protein
VKATLAIAAVAVFVGVASAVGIKLMGGWDDVEGPPASAAPATTTEREATTTEEAQPPQAPKVSPAKERWLRQVNRLCRQAEAEADRYVDDPPKTPAEAEKWFGDIIRMNARYNDRFAALEPVPADRHKVTRLLALLDREERVLAGMLAALESRDNGAFVELGARLTSVAESETDLLLDLGADDCGGDLFAGAY